MTCSQGCDKVPPPGLQGLTDAERRKAEEGTESREPATAGADRRPCGNFNEEGTGSAVRGGVLSLPKMTTGLSISGLSAGAVNIVTAAASAGFLAHGEEQRRKMMQDNPRLLRHFEIFGRHRAASKEQQG